MGIFVRIAWRNILRHKKRSVITMTAVAIGVAAIVFLWSFVDGFSRQVAGGIKDMLTGDFQIGPVGADGIYNVSKFLEDSDKVREVVYQLPNARITEHIQTAGIISSPFGAMTGYIHANAITKNRPRGTSGSMVEGKSVEEAVKESGENHWVALGAPVAKTLKAGVGDKIVLVMQDIYGSLVGESFHVSGIFRTGQDQVDRSVHISLEKAQSLMSLGNQLSKVIVRVPEGTDIAPLVQSVKQRLDPEIYHVAKWNELIPILTGLVEFQQRMMHLSVLIVLFIISAGVLNTLMMSFLERIREFGLMKSLGTSNWNLAGLLFIETTLISLIGVTLGLVLGMSLVIAFGNVGIDLSLFGETFTNLLSGTIIFPKAVFVHILFATSVIFLGNIFVSFIPAWRASRLEPVEAMRQVG